MNNSETEKLFGGIPRTPEEMAELEDMILRKDTQSILDKTYAANARIEMAKRMVIMFDSEEFKAFWKKANTDMGVIDVGVRNIKGNPARGGFDPLGQLVQLNNMQGALEMLEAQAMQVELIRKTAAAELVDTEELKEKVRQMKGEN